ncbi:hypothetical protein A3B45_02480 [Candidatus Daviesbacteria bacterium RIFCSPLOWO2_01_FULL_39_12]|uniref:YdbS-like PH domain-containing protein n=1 Tax=Candidatus Daviesbacteria bacterium RIFCSPLOWO2_01_FULL_39_12 TaxID=1797785 RepID=A0A1F5KSH2_9BACT|nr:MAG: hypothetical protein A3B45_02480 [Candidatus Daviesbacteria bacterium RIFCSPLOWO2_01_FULL_39_12]
MAKFHYKESPSEKQKKAFSAYLSEDEDLVLATSFSKAYVRSMFTLYLLFPGLLVGGLGFGLGLLLRLDQVNSLLLALGLAILTAFLKTLHIYHANRYLLTTRRVIIKRGLFSVKLMVALYDKITHLEVDQSFVDRLLLHHGSVIVNTAGLNKGEIVLKLVDYPMEIKNLLERLINREREQMGMRAQTLTEVEGEIIS